MSANVSKQQVLITTILAIATAQSEEKPSKPSSTDAKIAKTRL